MTELVLWLLIFALTALFTVGEFFLNVKALRPIFRTGSAYLFGAIMLARNGGGASFLALYLVPRLLPSVKTETLTALFAMALASVLFAPLLFITFLSVLKMTESDKLSYPATWYQQLKEGVIEDIANTKTELKMSYTSSLSEKLRHRYTNDIQTLEREHHRLVRVDARGHDDYSGEIQNQHGGTGLDHAESLALDIVRACPRRAKALLPSWWQFRKKRQ